MFILVPSEGKKVFWINYALIDKILDWYLKGDKIGGRFWAKNKIKGQFFTQKISDFTICRLVKDRLNARYPQILMIFSFSI